MKVCIENVDFGWMVGVRSFEGGRRNDTEKSSGDERNAGC